MDQAEHDLRAFARRVHQVANLAATAPTTKSLDGNVAELRGHAGVLLERQPDKLIHAQVEAIRDRLCVLMEQLGGRLLGQRIRPPYPEGVRLTAIALQSLSSSLLGIVDDGGSAMAFRELAAQIAEEQKEGAHRRAIQITLARVDYALQRCCWNTGLCETEFEPFRPGESTPTWFARFRKRIHEFGAWLVEERMAPLAIDIHQAASVLSISVDQLVEVDISNTSATKRDKARRFMRHCFRQVVAHVDAAGRRPVGKRLGEALALDPDRVPPLYFLEYFEIVRGSVERAGAATKHPTRSPVPHQREGDGATVHARDGLAEARSKRKEGPSKALKADQREWIPAKDLDPLGLPSKSVYSYSKKYLKKDRDYRGGGAAPLEYTRKALLLFVEKWVPRPKGLKRSSGSDASDQSDRRG